MALMLAQILPLKPQAETTLTATVQCGQWNTGRGTRKELKASAKQLRAQVKREKVIWERWAEAMKASEK